MLPWKKKKESISHDSLPFKEIRFNVAWNIWREVAECGVFLIPFFLGTGSEAIPLSALVGIAVALVIGIGIYIANQRMKSKVWLAFFMGGLTMFLAIGLFVGGLHEFEEVYGMTKNVWAAENDFWSHKDLPMVILKPFGYSASRSVLQITTFWLSLALGCTFHFLKWNATQKYRAEFPEGENLEPTKDVEIGDTTEGGKSDNEEVDKEEVDSGEVLEA
jgi:high-affinity iron transporter